VTLSVNDTSKIVIVDNASGTGNILDSNGKKVIQVKAGGTVRTVINGNQLYFTGNNGTKYYARIIDANANEFDGWSIGNDVAITTATTITAKWKAIPWQCPSGSTLVGTTCIAEASASQGTGHCTSWSSTTTGSCSDCAMQAPSDHGTGLWEAYSYEMSYEYCRGYSLTESNSNSCPINESSSTKPHLNRYTATKTVERCTDGYYDTVYTCPYPSWEWTQTYEVYEDRWTTICKKAATR
jgi:hypothetical protein